MIMTEDKIMIWVYIVSVLTISFLIGGIVSKFYSKESKVWQAFPIFYTFLPALTAVATQALYKKPITWDGWGFHLTGHWFYYVLAFLFPFVYLSANAFVQILFNNYSFKKDIKWSEIVLMVLLQQIVLPLFIIGEEIGWRGFLQNKLLENYGLWTTIVILGAVWGIWHAPLALKGYNLPDHPKFEAFIFYPFICIMYSAIIVFLTLMTKSILPAILFHTTNNNLGGISLLLFDKQDEKKEILIYFILGGFILMMMSFILLRV